MSWVVVFEEAPSSPEDLAEILAVAGPFGALEDLAAAMRQAGWETPEPGPEAVWDPAKWFGGSALLTARAFEVRDGVPKPHPLLWERAERRRG